jgi:hypothetical protein
MARYAGNIGYAVSQDQGNGVWEDHITELPYYGDVIKDNRKLSADEDLGGNISVRNSFSVVADDYAMSNFDKIRYLEWSGVNWAVTQVTVEYPRLILRIGEVYNGPAKS